MIRRFSQLVTATLAALALMATASSAFNVEVANVRITEQASGERYSLRVTTQGADVRDVASVAFEFQGGPEPEDRLQTLALVGKKNRGRGSVSFPAPHAGQAYSLTATLKSSKGQTLGTPQTFEARVGGAAVETNVPAEVDVNGRVQRIRLLPQGGQEAVVVVLCDGNLIDRVASVELAFAGEGAPSAPVVVGLDTVVYVYNTVVDFDGSAVGETVTASVTMLDAEGKTLGTPSSVEVEVEPSGSGSEDDA